MSNFKLNIIEFENDCEKREMEIADADCYFAGTYLIWAKNNSFKPIHGDTFVFNGEDINNEDEVIKQLKKIHKKDMKANSTSELNECIRQSGNNFYIEIVEADFYDSEMGYDLVLDTLHELKDRFQIEYGNIEKNKIDIYNMKGLVKAFDMSLTHEEKTNMEHVLQMINWKL